MLPKKNRVDRRAVEKIFKEGRFLNSPGLTFKFIIQNNSFKPKISFVAPKSVAKLAVKRNSLRRKGYAVLGKFIDQFPLGTLGVFIYKKAENDISIIENEIKNILSKIN